MTTGPVAHRQVVSRAEWLSARTALLSREKQLTRQRDEVSRQRRELPWTKVEKDYVFDAPDGPVPLAGLFGGRSQLVVYHFMFAPGWEAGCPSCSLVADHFDGAVVHLAQRDVTLLAVSRAPLAEIEVFRRRMGWRFGWVSSNGSDFNFDYGVSFRQEQIAAGEASYNYAPFDAPLEELQGISVFYQDASGDVYHTYSSYARGVDPVVGAYHWLDLVPKGRDEDGLAFAMAWVRHHDRYDESYAVDPEATYAPPAKRGSCCHS
jgi:predicted dithiol-disulfide oxidoreductase (DUF899 family)